MSDTPDDEADDGAGASTEDGEDVAGGMDGDDDPFADLEDVEVEADPFGDLDAAAADDQFDEVEGTDGDDSHVWEALDAQEDGATDVAVGGDLPDVDVDADEQIVPKRSYCEKCEHFTPPPETACTHPGTEIRELVDMQHFRVASCPVVAQRRDIGEYDTGSGDD